MEKDPWWMHVQGPFPVWAGRPLGVKQDGGGNVRGQGRVGRMLLHRAVCNRDADGVFCKCCFVACVHVALCSWKGQGGTCACGRR
jgi:hypothetical protein